MRLYNYLNESRSKNLQEDEAIEMLKNNCMQAVNQYRKGYGMWRGTDTEGPFLYRETTPGQRKSAFADHNYYTLIINNHYKWTEYPTREVIGSVSRDRAAGHGARFTYNVFPFDGARIGVCPEDDIWESFPLIRESDFAHNLDEFNRKLHELLIFEFNIPRSDSWPNLQKKLRNITFEMIEDIYDWEKPKWVYDWEQETGRDSTLYEYISYLFDPNDNGFTVEPISKLIEDENLEAWTDSHCILIDEVMTEEIIEQID